MAVLGEDAGAHVGNDRMPGLQRVNDFGAVLADPLSGDAAQPADGAYRFMAEAIAVVVAVVVSIIQPCLLSALFDLNFSQIVLYYIC